MGLSSFNLFSEVPSSRNNVPILPTTTKLNEPNRRRRRREVYFPSDEVNVTQYTDKSSLVQSMGMQKYQDSLGEIFHL